MNVSHELYHNEPSWDQFHESVARKLFLQGEKLDPISNTEHDGAHGYFDSVTVKAVCLKAENPEATEGEVAKGCTDMLVRLPNIVLENAVVDVYDFSSSYERDGSNYYDADDIAKRLMYMGDRESDGFGGILGRLPNNDFPECAIRLSGRLFVHNETLRSFQAENGGAGEVNDQILAYDHLPALPTTSSVEALPVLARSLQKDRNSPFRVAFVIGVQSFNKRLGAPRDPTIADMREKQALLAYLQLLLDVTPGRHIAFAAVTNFHECFFVALKVRNTGGSTRRRSYQPFNSSVIIGKEKVARELARFCATDPRSMGLNPALFHSPHLTINSYFGRGSTGVLMEGHWQEDPIVLAVSIHKGSLELERILLTYLEAKRVAHVPRIHKEAQEDLFPRYNEACNIFSTPYVRRMSFIVLCSAVLNILCVCGHSSSPIFILTGSPAFPAKPSRRSRCCKCGVFCAVCMRWGSCTVTCALPT